MYAILCTRPDIYHTVGMVNRYQSNRRPKYWAVVVKHIFKYLKRTRDYMLTYEGSALVSIISCQTWIIESQLPNIVSQGQEHIEQKYHPTWEIVQHVNVIVIEVASIDNLEDLFVKAFQLHVDKMGVRCDIL